MGGDECIHGLVAAHCRVCRLKHSPPVYVSGGGQAYHHDQNCPALARGKRKIDTRGGELAPLETVTLYEADRRGYAPCERCAYYTRSNDIPQRPHVPAAPPTVWVCAEEWSRKSLRVAGRFHEHKSCESLVTRLTELPGTLQAMERGAARRNLNPCPNCRP